MRTLKINKIQDRNAYISVALRTDSQDGIHLLECKKAIPIEINVRYVVMPNIKCCYTVFCYRVVILKDQER